MADRIERASAWIYSGLWSALTNLFLVPRDAPSMPVGSHEIVGSFRPAPGSLRYAKLFFWIGLLALDAWLAIAWVAIAVASPLAGVLLFIPAVTMIVVPDLFAYVAIHLRYDTTWYVLTDRSMRLRTGVLLLNETTITYENIQNVAVEQGPVQRYFGISNLIVQTAGGGGGAAGHGKGGAGGMAHMGRIAGLDAADAARVRDMIMTRVRASRSAGLGDEHAKHTESHGEGIGFTREHVGVLREIRDVLAHVA